MDHEGMLVEGFEEFNMSITFYNHPYYIEHMEHLGLIKDIDWIEYKISVPNDVAPVFERISNKLVNNKGFEVVTYTDRKVLHKEALEAFRVIDVAFSKLYGTVPLTPDIIDNVVKGYIPLVHLDYICSVKNPEGKIVGYEVTAGNVGRNAEELLRKVQACQFVHAHGDQVCPANWKPGAETLKPSLDLVGQL
jgi:hypothetical protein